MDERERRAPEVRLCWLLVCSRLTVTPQDVRAPPKSAIQVPVGFGLDFGSNSAPMECAGFAKC